METLRDATYEGFLYAIGNLLRTRRYGAQESRTGTVKNHIVAIALCDGEVFSNLYFTQALYDRLENPESVAIADLKQQAVRTVRDLLDAEPICQRLAIFGNDGTHNDNDLEDLLKEVTNLYCNESAIGEILTTLNQQTQHYAAEYGAKAKEKKSSKKKSS